MQTLWKETAYFFSKLLSQVKIECKFFCSCHVCLWMWKFFFFCFYWYNYIFLFKKLSPLDNVINIFELIIMTCFQVSFLLYCPLLLSWRGTHNCMNKLTPRVSCILKFTLSLLNLSFFLLNWFSIFSVHFILLGDALVYNYCLPKILGGMKVSSIVTFACPDYLLPIVGIHTLVSIISKGK